ncbi:N-acetyl-gamma-glutamyl-phosphate reductase [Thalassoglobus sp. JC818]|uniref:N-acetyl-gamma-glutamyl-phosphate reductase n=1 Tax=Thalassoglobus sp. JC818 TaxID=3232136 RepID=UPI003459871F
MVRVGVIGGTGYTALEVMRLLQRHPHVEVTVVTSRSETGPVSSSHPSLTGQVNVDFTNPDPEEIAEKTDICFCCLPHKASMDCIPSLLAADVRVVDLSADYRLSDPSVYEKWYGHVHTDPTRLGTTVYGLPELYRDQIRGQKLVANPGCYTSTSILALAPFLKADLIDPRSIIIDAKSGVSGAGRSPKVATLYAECNESFSAYSVGNHRHTPEIEQVLSNTSGKSVEVLFTPHLVPMDRGIFATIYATPARDTTESELKEVLREFYSNERFVRVVDHLPRTKEVAYTNFCDVTVRLVRGRVMILAVLDNMIKGAAGVAVQNFNLISGFEEETALL